MLNPPDFSKSPIGDLMPHVWYERTRQEVPDILVGRWHEAIRSSVGDEYKAVFAETRAERAEADAALLRPLKVIGNAMDLTHPPMARPSGVRRGRLWVVAYDPPAAGWPFLIVTMLPENVPGNDFGRQCYGWDAFMSAAAALRHLEKIACHGRAMGAVRVEVLWPS